MNIGINGYRQQSAFGADFKTSNAGLNKEQDADRKALDVANVPPGTKRMAVYLLETKQAKDIDDALDKASNPNFKAKSFGDLLGAKMGG
ncbi:MAG: hypothetical protein FWC23_09235 [Chitinispirillia bacterium]|nr:hypothetical protein [Chitinispirillia bacterium]MCL2269352.1 hypothetical protein [Chitinispirillia bacterium]